MKEAWDTRRDELISSGAFAIEQLSEALSVTADFNKLPVELPQKALNSCAKQVVVLTKSYFGSMS